MDRSRKSKNKKKLIKDYIAVIPARGGSKGIKNKNMRKISNIPLVGHAINFAKSSKKVKKIYVSSDSNAIYNYVKNRKVNFILRPKRLSTDKIMPDASVVHAIKEIDKNNIGFKYVVFIQSTSLLRKNKDLENAIKKFEKYQYDSLFSGVNLHSMIWKLSKNKIRPLNFNIKKRLMRQDIKNKTILENGSFYITKRSIWLKKKQRCWGKIGFYEMNPLSILEVDSKKDLETTRNILKFFKT
tara:strand:- start:13129 stop:13851 length:723 start_codon:yes stop_codon:yes gene_type:complete